MVNPAPSLKILSWNINGLRSFPDFAATVQELDADILCFQETKITRDMLTESVCVLPGFTSYFSFSKARSGYSGVATYCREGVCPSSALPSLTSGLPAPVLATLQQELSQEELRAVDSEGRAVVTQHRLEGGGELWLLNLYCPRADPERQDRAKFKLDFYKAVDIVCSVLLLRPGAEVIVLGDINTSHREIDHCDPYEEFGERPDRRFLDHFLGLHKDSGGEVQGEEDGWACRVVPVKGGQFLDSFRSLHPGREGAFTCWNTEKGCRATNYGTRIDYIFSSKGLGPHLRECDVMQEVQGSDHCPVFAVYDLRVEGAVKAPHTATKYFIEFQGKQVKLSNFFTKVTKEEAGNKRKLEEMKSHVAKKPKPDSKTKITSFFTSKQSKTEAVPEPLSEEVPEETELCPPVSQSLVTNSNSEAKTAWSAVFSASSTPAPLCPGHREAAVRRRVNKKGPNIGRWFWCCARGEGRQDDPQARCNFFKWVK